MKVITIVNPQFIDDKKIILNDIQHLEEQLKMIDDIVKLASYHANNEISGMECYSFLKKVIGE